MTNDPSNRSNTSSNSIGPLPTAPSVTTLKAAALTNRTIRLALVAGIVIIAVILASTRTPDEDGRGMIFLLVGGVVWISTFIASFVVPAIMTKTLSASGDASYSHQLAQQLRQMAPEETLPWEVRKVTEVYATNKIVQAALLEGGCIINIILWFMGGPWLLLVMVGINLLVMLATCPTIPSLRDALVRHVEETSGNE